MPDVAHFMLQRLPEWGCIAKALLGKDVVPDDLPIVTGAIGLLGTEPTRKMIMVATRCS
ncbi:MAG: hypothetical protein ACR2K2_03540 [Mycobacteriales bacterium]